MKKIILTLLAIAALALAGCQEKPKTETPSTAAPSQMPAAGQPAANPHAGMKAMELPAGAGQKGKVTQTMDSGGYTYVEAADEKGQKVWMALPQTKVAVGDAIEYPAEAMPMTNFHSKTLNRTFDKILFIPGIRVIK